MIYICPAVSLTQPQQPEGGKREIGEKGGKEGIQMGGVELGEVNFCM